MPAVEPERIKEEWLKAISTRVDPIMTGAGFRRRRRSLIYIRSLPGCTQKAIAHLHPNPPYNRGAIAHVHPHVHFLMPRLRQAANEAVGQDAHLLPTTDAPLVRNTPWEWAALKKARGDGYASSLSELDTVAQDLGSFALKWGLPFLDAYKSTSDIVAGYKNGDERIDGDLTWRLYLAMAHYLEGDLQGAREVVRKYFGEARPRREYASVFTFLEVD